MAGDLDQKMLREVMDLFDRIQADVQAIHADLADMRATYHRAWEISTALIEESKAISNKLRSRIRKIRQSTGDVRADHISGGTTYYPDDDILVIKLLDLPPVRDESQDWHVCVSFSADDKIVELVILEARQRGFWPIEILREADRPSAGVGQPTIGNLVAAIAAKSADLAVAKYDLRLGKGLGSSSGSVKAAELRIQEQSEQVDAAVAALDKRIADRLPLGPQNPRDRSGQPEKILLGNASLPDISPIECLAIVDAVSLHLRIPEHVATQLKLRKIDERVITQADGTARAFPYVGPISLQFRRHRCCVGAVVMGDRVLLGRIALDSMDLAEHPTDSDI